MSASQSERVIKFIDSDISKFQTLYLKYFDLAIDGKQARAELSLLVRQLEIIYQPITVSQFDEYICGVFKKEELNAPHL